jgi:hypothetical protein
MRRRRMRRNAPEESCAPARDLRKLPLFWASLQAIPVGGSAPERVIFSLARPKRLC